MQLCQFEMLKSQGVLARAYCGHSFGEFVAAYAAGILEFQEIFEIAYQITCAISKTGEECAGTMLSAMIAIPDAENMLCKTLKLSKQEACIGCDNVNSVVFCGTNAAMQLVEAELQASDVFYRDMQSFGIPWHSELISQSSFYSHLREGLEANLPRFKHAGRLIRQDSGLLRLDGAAGISAETIARSLVSSVSLKYLMDNLKDMPAVMIEIAPEPLYRGCFDKISDRVTKFVCLESHSWKHSLRATLENLRSISVADVNTGKDGSLSYGRIVKKGDSILVNDDMLVLSSFIRETLGKDKSSC